MRESKREAALEAAKRIIQRDGVTGLSYEAVAAEAGLTKGGLLYHFPSREDLLVALHGHVAQRWEQAMEAEGGAPAAELDRASRFGAFVRASQYPDRAELLLMLEASENPVNNAIWDDIYHRWVDPVPDSADASAEEVQRFIARLAADGLWLYESLATEHLDPELRRKLADQITAWGAPEASTD
ncbi:TetR/AcrR family transcriptional regulator [Nesterenkonia sphaerica]|uniref:TetR family transcriptional regulator n=1 Tax=Nesterenkonia sphaerica TaxID=1804988 RepID=A0A5R9A4G6_9MICC|nr:TetR/AcrR family transcriptional regulator [Nesterenkonia sphaerica]TLP73084.1 TetR family transcriptional regulator [Nesterenkonia sphaerica]